MENYELPKVKPVTHEELMMSVGHSAIRRFVHVTQPSLDEVKQMLELAEELPNKELN